MSERRASMGDKVYRGDVVKFIRNNINLGTFMKRTVEKADEACWDLCDKLNFVPAIEEAQPERKKGKWILVADTNGQHCVCDHCGEWKYHQEQKFCGECGYVMMEEGEE